MRRLVLLIALALLSVLPGPSPAAAAEISVSHNQASSNFPDSLRFELAASSSASIEQVVLLYALGLDETFIEVHPEFEPGTSIQVRYERDTQTYFLPTGVPIRYKWLLQDQSGASFETPIQELVYEDQRFDWRALTERQVTVRWYDGGDTFGRMLMDSALNTLDRFQQQFGSGLSDPVRITIYADTGDMRAALPPNSEEWVGGQARPELGLVIGAIGPDEESEIARLIPHELSHLILHQVTHNPYGGPPPWFDEGLAVVNQDVPDREFDLMVDEAAREDRLIPLRALAASFPADPEQALLSYAESASVVRFIQQEFGADGIAALIKQFAAGATPDEATQAALGLSVDELDERWRATLPAVEEPAATATPALRAPADRWDVETPRQAPGPGGSERPGTAAGEQPAAIGGIPVLWFVLALAVGLGLLLIGGLLIVRALRRSG